MCKEDFWSINACHRHPQYMLFFLAARALMLDTHIAQSITHEMECTNKFQIHITWTRMNTCSNDDNYQNRYEVCKFCIGVRASKLSQCCVIISIIHAAIADEHRASITYPIMPWLYGAWTQRKHAHRLHHVSFITVYRWPPNKLILCYSNSCTLSQM